ncbi:MAG: mechanosensitive ion channel family protein, partial [Flavobacterium sp.]|nr:mechanosensitive ion channel family protein [Flavobacterium sp.]
ITVIIGLIAFLLLLWRLADFISGFTQKRMNKKGRATAVSVILFLRRAAKVAIVVFGTIVVLDTLGFDVTTGLAALGIGGIALALGAQKTVENFVGSVTLIADQPIRVGDFCTVSGVTGTVEQIGMRSTRIRTLGRTVVSIPNGEFSSSKIENYAHRDRFLLKHIFDLRYETTPDQIRYLLVELRTILYAHPMVNPDPARVRFISLASSSLQLEIYAYIDAPNFDVFLEVQEDLLLRMMDTVAASGTNFAFPSRTIYMARDKGLSEEKSAESHAKVSSWRESNDISIPNFEKGRIEELKGSITYPADGSVGHKIK